MAPSVRIAAGVQKMSPTPFLGLASLASLRGEHHERRFLRLMPGANR
jgi:hypothetical protein